MNSWQMDHVAHRRLAEKSKIPMILAYTTIQTEREREKKVMQMSHLIIYPFYSFIYVLIPNEFLLVLSLARYLPTTFALSPH